LEEGNTRILSLDPVEIKFSTLALKLKTIYYFEEASSMIKIERKVLKMSRPAQIEIDEYITACYGTTEYPEDMTSIKLYLEGDGKKQVINYNYKCREASAKFVKAVQALIPPINTLVSVFGEFDTSGYIREGYAFSPMFTLGLTKELKEKEMMVSWLKLEKVD
jgi:hypothetical protein